MVENAIETLPVIGGEEDYMETEINEDEAVEIMRMRKENKKKAVQTVPSKSSVQVACVVKLFVKKVNALQMGPWKMSSESSCTGSGFILSNKRILTNAHVVHRGQSILCRAQSGGNAPKKWQCVIESISLPMDLAVLQVMDESFFDDKPWSELVEPGFENLPHLDDNVTAVGFPTGGDQISVTRGVVSRITHTGDILRVQIDAAINPGNSGGPVFDKNGKVVGVASAALKNSSNIGYIIPSTIVHLFFHSTKETGGRCNAAARSPSNPEGYCGVACVGISSVQTLENPTLRKYLGIEDRDGGVRVVSVDPLGGCVNSESNEPLVHADDVLLKINDILIGQDGTVQIPGRAGERIHFTSIISCRLPDIPVALTLIRKGQEITVSILPKPRQFACPRIDGYDAKDPPLYLICGGCVFTVLTRPWLSVKKKYDPLLSHYGGPLIQHGKQIVMLSNVLASSVNVGYHNLGGLVLRAFDGVEVFSLQHLATMIESSKNQYLEFLLLLKPHNSFTRIKKNGKDDSSSDYEMLAVLDREQCKKKDPVIRKNHLIMGACSPDIDFDW